MEDADKLASANASADDAPPATPRRRRSRQQTAAPAAPPAAPAEAPVPDQHALVRVRNTCKKAVHSPSGSVKAGEIGSMKLLDANRLRAYVEIISG